MGDLRRFVEAQAPVFESALSELKAGRRRIHWMWFVFPQLKALGRSSMAQSYGLHDLTEARSYWSHPVLGSRLKQCVLAQGLRALLLGEYRLAPTFTHQFGSQLP